MQNINDLMKQSYDEVKIARTKVGVGIVSTIKIFGGWETSITHPAYCEGIWIPVQNYSCCDDCTKVGHRAWVKKLKDGLPASLTDIRTGMQYQRNGQ